MAAVEAAEHLAEAAEAAAVESVAIAVVVALNHNNLWFLPNHQFENVNNVKDSRNKWRKMCYNLSNSQKF